MSSYIVKKKKIVSCKTMLIMIPSLSLFLSPPSFSPSIHTHTHTHTHIYLFMNWFWMFPLWPRYNIGQNRQNLSPYGTWFIGKAIHQRIGNSLVVQCLWVCTVIAKYLDLIPGRGTKDPTSHRWKKKITKNK